MFTETGEAVEGDPQHSYGNILRAGVRRWEELGEDVAEPRLEVSGKRGISAFAFRDVTPDETFTHFEDRPAFEEVDVLGSRYLDAFVTGGLDRLDVAYMKFESASRQRVSSRADSRQSR